MNILSIQSEVVYGHVGQGAARFALQRLGHEVWAIPTVSLSNHAGYPHVEGGTIDSERMLRLLDGIARNGWLETCDAVVSGYLGDARQADFVADALLRTKRANPKAIYCLDPVMGDDGRAYVKPGVAEAIARTLLPLADIVTPNAFELTQLSGLPVRDRLEASRAIARLGRALIVATSIPDGSDRIGNLASRRGDEWFVSTRRFDDVPKGAGDLFAALILSAHLAGLNPADALRRATASVFAILSASLRCDEMRLIECQNALAEPPNESELEVGRVAS